MNQDSCEDSLQTAVYVCLLGLTVLTLVAGSLSHGGRIMAVSLAVIIAAVKAGLIGFYFMDLRRETGLTWIILAIGALAVGTLLAGIIPDMTFARL